MNEIIETVGAVRERERESYTLVKESAVLIANLIHRYTYVLNNKNKRAEKKSALKVMDKKENQD